MIGLNMPISVNANLYMPSGIAACTDTLVYIIDLSDSSIAYDNNGVTRQGPCTIQMFTNGNQSTLSYTMPSITNPQLQTFNIRRDGKLFGPVGLAVTKDNVLYICDRYNHVIKMIQNSVSKIRLVRKDLRTFAVLMAIFKWSPVIILTGTPFSLALKIVSFVSGRSKYNIENILIYTFMSTKYRYQSQCNSNCKTAST